MYNIILCDDDEQFISYMHKLILASELTDKEVQFYEYNSGRKLTESLSNIKDCDLCILDIGMEDMNGDETAKIFRKTFPSSVLIFCSGIFGPTTKSFEAEPFRYLLKSYTDEQMLEEIKNIVNRVKQKKGIPTILIKSPEGMRRIRPDQILYIEIYKRGSRIFLHPNMHGEEKSFTTTRKLSDLYESLERYGFAYAHSSYIVNIEYVKMLRFGEVQMIDNTILNVSRSREKNLKKAYIEGKDKY